MRRALAGGILVGLLLSFSVAATEVDPVAVLQKADAAFATNGIAGMVEVFREAIEGTKVEGTADPRLLPIYSLYADATRATGDSEGALTIAEFGLALARAAERRDPGTVAALAASRAYALIAIRPPPEAIAGLREAMALSEAAFGKVPSETYLRTELADRLEAAAQWDEAIALRREVVAIHGDGGDTEELIKAQQALARSLFSVGRPAEAVAAYRDHLALIERARPPGDADRVRAVNDLAIALSQIEENGEAATLLEEAVRNSEGVTLDPDLAAALNTNLAAAWSRTGRLIEAEGAALRAIALWQSIGKDADLSRARALNLLVEIDVELGRHDEALAASDLALDLTRGHETDPSGTAVEALDARGILLFSLQKFRQAAEIQRSAVAFWLGLRPEDSAKVIVARQNLAGTLVELGSLKEASGLLGRSAASADRALPRDSAILAAILSSRGTLLSRLGELKESAEAFERALVVWRIRAPRSALEARELSNLAAAEIGLGRIGEAEGLLHRSIGIWLDVAPEHPDLAFAYGNLIEVLHRQGRVAEALGLARRLVAKAATADGLPAANAHYALALLLRADGKPAEAEVELRRALDIRRAELGEKHPEVAATLGELCLVLWDQSNIRDALGCAGESLALHRAIFPARHREIGVALNNLAFVEASAGKLAEADREYREALEITLESYGPIHPAATVMTANLAIHLLDRVGRPAEALGLLRRASANAAAAASSEATESIGTDKLLQRARGIFAVEVRAAWAVATGVTDR